MLKCETIKYNESYRYEPAKPIFDSLFISH